MKTSIKMFALLAGVASIAMLASTASAQITYVDATTGNTTAFSAGSYGTFAPLASQGLGGDGLWDARAFGNSATIYQNASSGNTDNAQRLQTSVTGLTLGDYHVYAYFWSDTSSWGMQASLTDPGAGVDMHGYQFNPTTPGTAQYFTNADAGTVLSSSLGVNPFTTDVMISDGNRRFIQIDMGIATSVTGFNVFLDDHTLTENFAADGNPTLTALDQNHRTWYDGIGYAIAPVPEPTSMALLGLGALVGTFVVRRRKQ